MDGWISCFSYGVHLTIIYNAKSTRDTHTHTYFIWEDEAYLSKSCRSLLSNNVCFFQCKYYG